MKALLAAALLSGASSVAMSCDTGLYGDGVMQVESARYVLTFRSRPSPIVVGQHFALDLAACGKNGAPPPESLHVDARMPAHRHGMNYAPRVRRTAPGHWEAEGLLFHMPGLWEFRVDLRAADATDRLTRSYSLD